MNYHIMNVGKEPRNQTYNKHDHDSINDHNHEDTYWEHFLETKDELLTSKATESEQNPEKFGQRADSLQQLTSNAYVPIKSPEKFGVVHLCRFKSPPEGGDSSGKVTLPRALKMREGVNNTQLSLHSKWNYYYHLPNDKNWNLASYKSIMGDINTLEKLIAVNETVTNNIIKNCMLFVMREGVTPMWEDNCNRNGGCFSYKVSNKVVVNVWRELTYLLCGNSLTIDKNHMELVNGITISPKRGFCIVKIWLKNCSLQDPNIVVDVDNLIKVGCLFKTHKAEF